MYIDVAVMLADTRSNVFVWC